MVKHLALHFRVRGFDSSHRLKSVTSQLSAESSGFSPGTLVPSYRES